MFELPKSVKVAGFTYSIRTVNSIEEIEKDMDGVSGFIDFIKQEIVICTAFSIERQVETLLHEIIHAVHCHYHIESIVPNPEDEENLTTTTAEGLFQVFKDNPKFLPLFKRV